MIYLKMHQNRNKDQYPNIHLGFSTLALAISPSPHMRIVRNKEDS